jgi:hypothetical protein
MKSFRFWLSLLSIAICILNATGLDDKNMLLFFTSPHLMILEDYFYIIRHIDNEAFQKILLYFLNILGWFLIGWILDIAIAKLKQTSQ